MSLLLELHEIAVKLGLFKAIVNQRLPVAPELLGSARKSDGRGKDSTATPQTTQSTSTTALDIPKPSPDPHPQQLSTAQGRLKWPPFRA